MLNYTFYDTNEFVQLVKKGQIKFPFIRNIYKNQDIHTMFSDLELYSVHEKGRIISKEYTIKNLNYKSDQLLFEDNPLILIHKDEDYFRYDILSDMFQEKNRIKCKRFFSKITPSEYFHTFPEKVGTAAIHFKVDLNSSILRFLPKYIKDTIKTSSDNLKGKITPFSVRESIFKLTSMCSQFRPSTTVAIIQYFNATSLLDFSAGWGDRLLGAMAMKIKYTGIDPNSELHPVYQEMINFFHRSPKKYVMIKGEAEKVEIPDRKYDLVFTSPPFFDLEVFSSEPTQSTARYSTEKGWFNNFLKIAIEKSWKLLQPTGHFALNINQKNKQEQYVSWTIELINSFPNSRYLGVISYADIMLKNPQPIWIWGKTV